MLTREDLMHMRNMSFEDINPAEIPDLDEMNIDVTKSKREGKTDTAWNGMPKPGIILE